MKNFKSIISCEKKTNIVEDIMKFNGIYCLVAYPKVGKSFLALQLANSIANNKEFLGKTVSKSPVLYVSTELSANQIKDRLDITNYSFNDNSFFFLEKDESHKLNIKNDLLLEINEFVNTYNGKFVIIDMLNGIDYNYVIDTNNYSDMTDKVIGQFRELSKKYNITFLLVHHLNKNGKTLGSIGIPGSVDGILTLKDEGNENYSLSITNRDFPNLEFNLVRNNNLIFEAIEEDNTELDFNLSSFLKYVIKKREIRFTPSEIVAELNLQIAPSRFGRLLNSNLDRLKQEGIYVTECRTANSRNYKAVFIEPMNEEND